jgi:hypothetical protein
VRASGTITELRNGVGLQQTFRTIVDTLRIAHDLDRGATIRRPEAKDEQD